MFAKARDRAWAAACVTNTHQLTAAVLMYADDNDSRFYELAQGAATGEATSASLNWLGYLQPYLKNTRVALCPASAQHIVDSYGGDAFGGQHWRRVDDAQLSVGMIGEMAPWACWGAWDPALDWETRRRYYQFGFHSLADYPYPAQTAIFADSVPVDPGEAGAGYWADPYSGIDRPLGLSDRHMGGTNVGFIDGHVQWHRTETLVVADQVEASGQCINYDRAHVYYDPSAPYPDAVPMCEGKGIR